MNIVETAEALNVSAATVERDWTVAKAWLHQRWSPSSSPRDLVLQKEAAVQRAHEQARQLIRDLGEAPID